MGRHLLCVAAVLAVVNFGPNLGHAAESPELTLEQRIQRIEDMLGINDAPAQSVPNFAPSASSAPARPVSPQQAPAGLAVSAPPPTPATPAAGPTWTFSNNRPVITSEDKEFDLAIRGRFQFDAGTFFQSRDLPSSVMAGRDLHNGSYFRRAQIGVEGTVFRDFDYEFVFDFGSSATERAGQIYLLRLAYTGIPNVMINAGAIQPKFTMDDSTSSADLTFMERSSIVNTILDPFGGSDSRRGIEVRYQSEGLVNDGDNLLVTAAFTGARIAQTKADDEGTQILGRLAYRFYSNMKSNFQLGASAARIINEPDRSLSIGDRPETRVDGTRLVGFGFSNLPAAVGASSASLFGLEGAMNYGPLSLQGEYFHYNLERTNAALRDPSFNGWYLQGSYVLTGEMRPYVAGSAAFGAPSPRNPFRPGSNGWGAWELKARYSVNDLNAFTFDPNPANRVRGGEQTIISAGVNWYLNRNVRWLFDYSHVDVNRLDGSDLQAGQDFSVLAGRMQFSF
jgi:phosphate-selective porin OprO/OprP